MTEDFFVTKEFNLKYYYHHTILLAYQKQVWTFLTWYASNFVSYKRILHLKQKMVEFVGHVHFEKKFVSMLILGRYINFFVTVWSRDIIYFSNSFHFEFKNRHRVALSKTISQIMKWNKKNFWAAALDESKLENWDCVSIANQSKYFHLKSRNLSKELTILAFFPNLIIFYNFPKPYMIIIYIYRTKNLIIWCDLHNWEKKSLIKKMKIVYGIF